MKFLDWLTDKFALIATILVGIATTSYLSASIATELWSQIVMGILGGGLPLISVRFLIKRKLRFFWLTVGLIVFADTSFILSQTAGQAVQVVAQTSNVTAPPALTRLQKASDDAQGSLDELLRQQAEAKTRGTLDNLDGQIQAATISRDDARRFEREWKPETTVSARVNSNDVFMAIPAAISSGVLSRWMTLIFAALVAFVYQGTVIATVGAVVKQAKRESAEGKPKKRKRRVVAPRFQTPATELQFVPEVREGYDPDAGTPDA